MHVHMWGKGTCRCDHWQLASLPVCMCSVETATQTGWELTACAWELVMEGDRAYMGTMCVRGSHEGRHEWSLAAGAGCTGTARSATVAKQLLKSIVSG